MWISTASLTHSYLYSLLPSSSSSSSSSLYSQLFQILRKEITSYSSFPSFLQVEHFSHFSHSSLFLSNLSLIPKQINYHPILISISFSCIHHHYHRHLLLLLLLLLSLYWNSLQYSYHLIGFNHKVILFEMVFSFLLNDFHPSFSSSLKSSPSILSPNGISPWLSMD